MQIGNYRFDEDLAMSILEKVLIAAVILLVTWVLARAAKWAFAKLVDNVRFFQRHTGTGNSFGESMGKIVALLIWLFGLLAILQVFELGGVMTPVQTLLNNVMDVVPNLIGAALIFVIGMMVAKIVRDIVVTALQTVDFDRWLNRGEAQLSGSTTYADSTVADGTPHATDRATDEPVAGQPSPRESATSGPRISKTIGTIVYVLIVIPVALAALDVLDIRAISEPASNMLRLILNAIPNIIGAALLLGLGYVISKFVAQALREVLAGLGVDRSLAATGLVSETTSASSILARVAQIAIMLLATVAATRLLGFPELTAIVGEILELGAKVLFGAIVIGIGFLIAKLLARLIAGEDGESAAASIVKWATIVLFTFMGLTFMGVGEEIVQLAFGALVIGGGVAGALAFGLGGREWAGRKLEQMDEAARAKNAISPIGSTTTTTTPKMKIAPEDSKPLPPGA